MKEIIRKILNKYYQLKKVKRDKIIDKTLKNTEIDNYTIVFESEGDYSDNCRTLYEYMISQKLNKKYKLIWIVDDPSKYKKEYNVYFISRKYKTKKELTDFYQTVGSAKFLFFTHPYWYHKKNDKQIVINLWHGIPLKAGGRDLHDTFDYITIPSDFSKQLFQKFIGSLESQYVIAGSPRNDLLFSKNDSLEKITSTDNISKVILCMTTFKQSENMKDSTIVCPFVLPCLNNEQELIDLNEELQKLKVKIIIKIHHLQKTDVLSKINMSNIIYLEDYDLNLKNIQLYELVGQTDALITDYSSIMFDYMLIDKPIAYFINDLEDYKKNRGFLVDNINDYMIGEKMLTKKDLLKFISDVVNNKDDYKEQRHKFAQKMFKYKNNNCQRILDIFNIK